MHPLIYFTRPLDSDDKLAYWIRSIAFVDVLMLGYLLCLNIGVLFIEPGPVRTESAQTMGSLLAAYVAIVIVLVRARIVKQPWLSALLYRATHFGCIEVTYFSFRDYLPGVNPETLDLELIAFDLKWFGIEPALYFDQFVTPFTTEWFSFFYYSYFLLVVCHVVPVLFLGKNQQRIAELGLGLTLITCLGQATYMLVPGYGPFQAIPEQFTNELPPGFWFDHIMHLVQTNGALKDIFPSLHTAIPLLLLLFNFRHRALFPYKFTWPIVGFFALNIIISTMFLRWHYLIDVIAGILLALAAQFIAVRTGGWEQKNRERLGLEPTWPRWTKDSE